MWNWIRSLLTPKEEHSDWKYSPEQLKEISESLEAYHRGEIDSYEDVFGHPQPGLNKDEGKNSK